MNSAQRTILLRVHRHANETRTHSRCPVVALNLSSTYHRHCRTNTLCIFGILHTNRLWSLWFACNYRWPKSFYRCRPIAVASEVTVDERFAVPSNGDGPKKLQLAQAFWMDRQPEKLIQITIFLYKNAKYQMVQDIRPLKIQVYLEISFEWAP